MRVKPNKKNINTKEYYCSYRDQGRNKNNKQIEKKIKKKLCPIVNGFSKLKFNWSIDTVFFGIIIIIDNKP